MISLIHPSRGRVEKSVETIKKWVSRSTLSNFEIIVSLDSTDPRFKEYVDKYHLHKSEITSLDLPIVVNDNRSAVDAINRGAEAAKGDIFIIVSDDTDCPGAWDEKILNAVQGKSDYLLRVNDGIQKWLCTMPVMDRTYYDRFGYVYHPDYLHCFVDTEMTHVADLLGRVIRRDDLHFPHLHYCRGHAKKDAINERADATWEQGKAVYLHRFKKSFGLSGVNPWDISNEDHKAWLRKALR